MLEAKPIRNTKGFTLIELLLVIGITLLVAGASIPLYGNLQVATQQNETTTLTIQIMRQARELSLARLNDTPHGVYFNINPSGDDQIILYQGTDYLSRDTSYDQVTTLASSLSLSTTFSGNDLTFSKGKGIPNQTGTITIVDSVNGSSTIDVSSLGKIEKI